MTEEEAKEKVCPFMSEGWFSRHHESSRRVAKQYCIASDCMMWVPESQNYFHNGYEVVIDHARCGLIKHG